MSYSGALCTYLIETTIDRPVALFLFAQFLQMVPGDCHVDVSDKEAAGAAEVLPEDGSNKSTRPMPYLTFELS